MIVKKNHYCDSEALEINWHDFIIAHRFPELEQFRAKGLIWSKPISDIRSKKKNGTVLLDPYAETIEYVVSDGRTIRRFTSDTIHKLINFCNSKSVTTLSELPKCTSCAKEGRQLCSKCQSYTDFRREKPSKMTWDTVSMEVLGICGGIAKKFAAVNDSRYDDICSDSMYAILNKIKNMKLKFTPGRAPVFSLLTMAIHREIYTVLNVSKRNDRLINMARDRADRVITGKMSRNRSAREAIVPVV